MNRYGRLKELDHSVFVIDMDNDKPDAWWWVAKNEDSAENVIQLDEKHARKTIAERKKLEDQLVQFAKKFSQKVRVLIWVFLMSQLASIQKTSITMINFLLPAVR